jgi:hypothetical protein
LRNFFVVVGSISPVCCGVVTSATLAWVVDSVSMAATLIVASSSGGLGLDDFLGGIAFCFNVQQTPEHLFHFSIPELTPFPRFRDLLCCKCDRQALPSNWEGIHSGMSFWQYTKFKEHQGIFLAVEFLVLFA